MQGIQAFIADDLFQLLAQKVDALAYQVFLEISRYLAVIIPYDFIIANLSQIVVSFFEIYGGRCQDLLNDRQRINVREDYGGEVLLILNDCFISSRRWLTYNVIACALR